MKKLYIVLIGNERIASLLEEKQIYMDKSKQNPHSIYASYVCTMTNIHKEYTILHRSAIHFIYIIMAYISNNISVYGRKDYHGTNFSGDNCRGLILFRISMPRPC